MHWLFLRPTATHAKLTLTFLPPHAISQEEIALEASEKGGEGGGAKQEERDLNA